VDGSVVRVGVLGCGNVGAALVRLVADRADEIEARTGLRLEVGKVAVRSLTRERSVDLPPEAFTRSAAEVVDDPSIDVIVEVIGGIEPARELILAAMKSGKPVITANKELLANHGAELFEASAAGQVDLLFEAAVAGGIPIVRPMRESLLGEDISRITGIVNGTTNFILSRMDATGAGFDEALAEATALGYAEADPTADVDGYDAASKAAILAGLAFHTRVTASDVHREGIGEVTAADMAGARAMGCTIKLLAICERVAATDGSREQVAVRVHPAMIPRTHPLAGVGDAFNAVFVEAEAAGSLMFYGRGAGGAPTASAVLGDLVAVARNRVDGRRGARDSTYAQLPIQPMGDVLTRFHVALDVADQPGVLASVAGAFAEHGVSIQTVRQEGRGDAATLVLVTHSAAEAALTKTVALLGDMPFVRGSSVLRVEGMSAD
jgi:homoserine dehydrogenase